MDTTAIDAVLDALQEAGVRSLTTQPPTLEDLFLRHYADGREPSGAEAARDRNP